MRIELTVLYGELLLSRVVLDDGQELALECPRRINAGEMVTGLAI